VAFIFALTLFGPIFFWWSSYVHLCPSNGIQSHSLQCKQRYTKPLSPMQTASLIEKSHQKPQESKF